MGCECCKEENPRDYEKCKVTKGLRFRNYTAPCGNNFVGNSNYTPPKKKKKRRK